MIDLKNCRLLTLENVNKNQKIILYQFSNDYNQTFFKVTRYVIPYLIDYNNYQKYFQNVKINTEPILFKSCQLIV